jgi:putative transposase
MQSVIVVRRTYKYKLYRNDKATKPLRVMIKVAARIYNHIIALQRRYYRLFRGYIGLEQMQSHVAWLRRKVARFAFWKELGSQAVQDVAARIDGAYQRFFAKKGGRPGFRKSVKYRSFTLKQTAGWKLITVNQNALKNAEKQTYRSARGVIQIGAKKYKFVQHRPLRGAVKTVTIKRDAVGQLWVCFSVIETVPLPEVQVSTLHPGGFDFGLKTFLTDHTGRQYLSPQHLRDALDKIAALSRAHSRKQPGSKHRKRARRALARAYIRIADKRRDFHFKLAHALCEQFDVLVFEDLNIAAMKKLWGRKVSDYGFSAFLIILEHVALLHNKVIIKIDRFTRTTSICSRCAHHQPMPLRERRFVCAACGLDWDRDHNAAQNILTAEAAAVLSRRVSPAPAGVAV